MLLLNAARFTIGYVRLVGQEPAPGMCVLLSTSREVRKDMKDGFFPRMVIGSPLSLMSGIWGAFGYYFSWMVFDSCC